ncbi:hypothetical protein C8R46DRAFT_1106598 [Mycena filopes]|nr:hypothetical protein C8R46DRAFT_1106598 [Mycena filopes]
MATAAAPAKTLSTGTLSLKFMQNAHRAKNLAAVQLERAAVKDDAEWEVAKEVREAWGPETVGVVQAVSYEASYLPFLFSAEEGDDADVGAGAPMKGRRAFKRGREVAVDEYLPAAPPAPPAASTSRSKESKSVGGKPRQISGRGGPGPLSSSSSSAKVKGKSARQAVFEDDIAAKADAEYLAEVKAFKGPPRVVPPKGFIKPAGVDAPPPPPESSKGERKPKRERRESGLDEAPSTGGVGAEAEDADADAEAAGTGAKKRKRRKLKRNAALEAEVAALADGE